MGEISMENIRYMIMEGASMRSYIRSLPNDGWVCHRVTLSLYRFAMTGKRQGVIESQALDFSNRLEDILSQANRVMPPFKNHIPPHLYSVYAIKNVQWSKAVGWNVTAHTALLIEVASTPVIAEGELFVRGISIIPLGDFLNREHSDGIEIYEFTPEVLKRNKM